MAKNKNSETEEKQKTKFANENVAKQYMYQQVDDPCIDNYRFAFMDDPKAVAEYENLQSGGCCGFYDEEIIVNGRPAMIGCNYGH